MRLLFTFAVWFAAALSVSAATNVVRSTAVPASVIHTNSATVPVTVFYFHGTVRCETCVKIETQARTVIERRFRAALKDKTLEFKPVNYDLPENRHFLSDFELPCPSLVLVRNAAPPERRFKLLDQTWELVDETGKFDRYIQSELERFINAGPAKTNSPTGPAVQPKS